MILDQKKIVKFIKEIENQCWLEPSYPGERVLDYEAFHIAIMSMTKFLEADCLSNEKEIEND